MRPPLYAPHPQSPSARPFQLTMISPTLANLTLDGLEQLLKDHFRRKMVNGEQFDPKVSLIRYADDFIITGATKEMLENDVRPMVEQFLLDRGLQLSPEKACITHIDEGFDFLGQNIRKFSGKLLIRPSKKNTHNFLDKARKIIRDFRSRHQLEMIRRLNPVVRGWVNYHRHVVVTKAFRKVERVMWKCLWRWAKRRHSGKPIGWIVSKYCTTWTAKRCLRRILAIAVLMGALSGAKDQSGSDSYSTTHQDQTERHSV
jgi:RNA-directed DNA polymerase